MKYHSQPLTNSPTNTDDKKAQLNAEFPFSITSCMEKGTLNRYDNIWPYGKPTNSVLFSFH
jgi:hypothetical protein